MNYDHANRVYDFYRSNIAPHFSHNFQAQSFDDYLKKFSFLPSGRWLQDMEKIKITRVPFAIDPEKLVKKFMKQCVTYNSPSKPDEGIQRVIYQHSPTLHFEAAFWSWIENDVVQSYATVISCYHDEKEYDKFIETLWHMRREGNTEDKTQPTGFNPISVGFGS